MNYSSKSVMLMVLSLAFAASLSPVTCAQTPDVTHPLQAGQYKFSRLAPGVLSDEAVFPIDSSGVVKIDILASIGGITTSVLGPAGQVIDENTIGALGGSFTTFEGTAQQDGLLVLPSNSPGFHYVFTFPWLGAGNYAVRFQAPASISQEVAIITHVTTDSRIGVKLFATEPTLLQGNRSVLTAAIFDGPTPIAGANVSVFVKPETGATVNFSLRDDGVDADDAAGDGLYSGEFTPGSPGRYEALALVGGTTAGGIAFSRQSTAEFDVVTPKGRLTGTVQDQGVDDNGDRLFDRVAVDVQTEISTAGRYGAFVHLKTLQGRRLLRSAEANLASGAQALRVNFEAAAFLQLGENGPYDIELIELVFIDGAGANVSDRRENVGQTRGYLLSQFQRPDIALTGVTSDQATDTNGNGLFDRLTVSVQVNVLIAGSYSWSFKLTDQSLREIDFASGSASFAAGLNNLQVIFDGRNIGRFGAPGPYQLRDVLVIGPRGSLVASSAGQTQPYAANQFEGFGAVAGTGVNVVGESCTPANGAADPGERVTVDLTLRNNGNTTLNITGTLQSSANVIAPSEAQSYGAVSPNGSATRTYSFTADGGCGQTITLTLLLQDGVDNIATVNYALTLGCNNSCAVPRLVASSTLARNGGNIIATVTVRNYGVVGVTDATVTQATLNSPITNGVLQSAPNLGSLGAGESRTTTVTFSGADNPPGAARLLQLRGSYNGGTFTSSKRVILP